MRKQKRHCQSSLTFENLWQEWLDTELFITGKSRKMEGMGYEEIFKSLPADEQKALLEKKGDALFAFAELLDIMSRSGKENVWNQ